MLEGAECKKGEERERGSSYLMNEDKNSETEDNFRASEGFGEEREVWKEGGKKMKRKYMGREG